MVLGIAWSIIGALAAALSAGALCFMGGRHFSQELAARSKELEAQADRAKAAAEAAERGHPPPAHPSPAAPAAAGAVLLGRDSIRAPLLDAIPEDASDAVALPVQSYDELPPCVQEFLRKAIRDGRRFK